MIETILDSKSEILESKQSCCNYEIARSRLMLGSDSVARG